MGQLTWNDFDAFFDAIHGRTPFPWQKRLAKRVCEGEWPEVIDLPTASGKTACLDIAVFAMAVRRCGPRRVFFVVDRRVVVDAAFERMRKIECALREPEGGVLKSVAEALREMAGGEEPLMTYQMRGGIYRDDSWVLSPRQPALVASTVDQTGSRLLFRGYGVWDKTLPIHAGLVGNDSLILLDEAHCSQPFAETLGEVRRYRSDRWTTKAIGVGFAFVEMTATPATPTDDRFELDAEDHAVMQRRLHAPKPVRLLATKARLKDFRKFAECLVDEAEKLAARPGLRRIAIMVNRVQSARLAWGILGERARRRHLLIGRMRPIDRLQLPPDLQAMLSGEPRNPEGEPVFVVATQCLEVGADLDFDAVVTECASIDALLQRFGRLDRVGDLVGSGFTAEGAVVIAGPMAEAKYRDPIYGEALSKTWNWLKETRDPADFAICSETGDRTVRERLKAAGDNRAVELRREPTHAPALLPAHLDAWVQTSPRPAIEPDVSLFLHGEQSGAADVQVVWRADLDPDNPDLWAEIVAMCPPVSMEAMPVPYRAFVAWLSKREDDWPSADMEGVAEEELPMDKKAELRCPVLRWRGDESRLVKPGETRLGDFIRPGDTLVLPVAIGGWNELGHVPDDSEIDVAERARHALRRGWILRLHPVLVERWPANPAHKALMDLAGEQTLEWKEVRGALKDYKDAGVAGWPSAMLEEIPKKFEVEAYPARGGVTNGWTLSAQFVEADAGGDESSAASPVLLDRHLKDVAQEVSRHAASVLCEGAVRESLRLAAELHDYGKVDARFQALLRGGDPMAGQFAPVPLAKGTQSRTGRAARRAQWARSGLPDGFRHELVSLLLAQTHPLAAEDELALHLIASHHGRCRPFAPVVDDRGGPLAYEQLRIEGERRIEGAAHRLENGVADRFWELTRQYGWWGLAYLETLLRLGDWRASKGEEREKAKEAVA